MARYNTSQSTGSITGSSTISSPYQGAFTELTGTAPYTVTLPSPVLYPGANQTFYNATSGVITLSTPAGIFTGTGGTSSATVSVYAGNVISVTSDGTNYIVISEDGSALIATTGNFSSNVDISGTLTVTPTGGINLSPSTTGTINNVAIGGTTRASGNFTTLAANNQVTFTGNISSTTTGTGTLVVTGGLGVSGTINAANVSANLTGTIQTAAQPNITSVGTLTSLTASGAISTSGDIITTGGKLVPYLKGITIPATVAAGWYRFASSVGSAGDNGTRGGFKATVMSTGGYQTPGQTVIYGFKDWSSTAQITRVEKVGAQYFTDWRLVSTTTTCYLEGYTAGWSMGGTNSMQISVEPYGLSPNTAWTVVSDTSLTAGLSSSTITITTPLLTQTADGSLGVSANPQAKLHVSAGTSSITPRGGGFTKFMFDNNTAQDIYLEIANNSTNTAGVLFSKGTGSYGLVNYNLSNDSLLLYANSSPRVVINSDGMVSVNASTSTFSRLGTRTAPKFWVQSGPAVMSNQTNGSTYPDYSATALMTGPSSTRTGTMGTYYGGIGFDHLLNYSSSGDMNYNNDPMIWIGGKMYDTPGYERSSFVIATREGTSGTEKTIERVNVDPFGRVTKPYQPSFSAYKNGNFSAVAGAVPVTGWTIIHNVGGALNASTGRFTAPVAGTYFFILSYMVTSQSTADTQSRWYRNGSYVVGSNHVFSATYNQVTVPLIVQLSAGDYVEPYLYSNATGPYLYTDRYTHIHGYLLG